MCWNPILASLDGAVAKPASVVILLGTVRRFIPEEATI
jgi:hypothetical protein